MIRLPDLLAPSSRFGKNVVSLTGKSLIAKVISLSALPFVTRIYSPSEMGLFACYLSCSSILAVLSSGRYELGVVQAGKAADAARLVLGVFGLTLFFCMVLTLALVLGLDRIPLALGWGQVSWIYALPMGVFLTSCYQVLGEWLLFKRYFQKIGNNRILQALTSSAGALGAGWFGDAGVGGLVFGQITGLTVSMLCIIPLFWPEIPKFKKSIFIVLAKKNLKYPKFELLASALNVLAQQLPNLLISPIFGPDLGGQFFLVQRALMTPITLLSSPIGSVFREAATTENREKGNFLKIFIHALQKLTAFGLGLAVLLAIFAEYIFLTFFGTSWALASLYLKILLPMSILKFITSPLTYAFMIRGKNHLNTVGQTAYLVATLTAFGIGAWAKSLTLAVIVMSISVSLVYLCYLGLSWEFAKPTNQNDRR